MVLLAFILDRQPHGRESHQESANPHIRRAPWPWSSCCASWPCFPATWITAARSKTSSRCPWSMGTAAALVFVAFSGAIKVGAIGGEVMDPETNLPRGMIQSLVIATVLYAVVAYIMVAVMDPGAFMTGQPCRREPHLGLCRLGCGHHRGADRLVGCHHRHGLHGSGGVLSSSSLPLRHGQGRRAARTAG